MFTLGGSDDTPEKEMFAEGACDAASAASLQWYQFNSRMLVARGRTPVFINSNGRTPPRTSDEENRLSFGSCKATVRLGCVRLPMQIHIFDCGSSEPQSTRPLPRSLHWWNF